MSVKYIKFWRGNTELFNNTIKDNDTIYFITDKNKSLYLGSNIISNYIQNAITSDGGTISGDLNLSNGASLILNDDLASYVSFKINNTEKGKFYYNNLGKEFVINNVTGTSSLLLKDDKSLVYKVGAVEHTLINASGVLLPSINKVFTATERGFVPNPGTSNTTKFLRGDGTWADVGISNNVTKTGSFVAGQVVKVNNTTGVIESSGYTIAKSVPSNAVFTDTWRGIQDNLSSDSSTDSLSAKQGKSLKTLIDAKPSTAYVDEKVAALVNSAPETLDTLNELAAALGNDPNFATTVSSQIGTKLDKNAYTAADVLVKLKTVDGAGSGLDADLLDGKSSAEFATSTHTHSNYTNQNAFSNIKVGATTIAADTATDTLELVAGSNITLTPDATNDKVTINASNTWRGIVDNLTSDSTTDSLSAKQGKALKTLVDGKLGKSEKAADSSKLNGIDSSRVIYGIDARGTTPEDVDANTILKSGFYASSGGTLNTPVAGGACAIIHTQWDGQDLAGFQISESIDKTEISHRTKNGGAWSTWRKLLDSNNTKISGNTVTINGASATFNNYTHPVYTARTSGFYKVTVDSAGHVNAVTAVTKADITALGIPGSDTNTWRGIVDNLTSDSAADSLSAKQGKALKTLVDGKLASSANAVSSSKLLVPDKRDTAITPESYAGPGIYGEFKSNTRAGLTDGGTYVGLMSIRKYGSGTDWSGGIMSQLAFSENHNVWHRTGSGTTFNAWKKLLDSNNTKISGNTVTINGTAATFNNYTHPAYTTRASGFYKVTVDSTGHVNSVAAVTKADITALGIPGSDTNTWRPVIDNLTSSATADSLSANQGRVLKAAVDGKLGKSEKAADSSWADTSRKVVGTYTGSGGKFIPSYVGKGRVCFNMSNEDVRGNTGYKDWIIMDTYSGDDAGGATAFGVYRSGLGAYIMQSDAARTSWNRKAELWGSHNFDPATKLNSSAYTAADVLAKIKTVDGAGSGLDADLLDGKSSGDFCLTTDARLSNDRNPTLSTGADWNTLITNNNTGFYTGAGGGPLSGSIMGISIKLGSTANYNAQFGMRNNQAFFRCNENGTKSSWYEFYHSGKNNIGTGATNYAAGNHSHSNYSSTSHTHSNYSLTSHTHNYAPSSHTHDYSPTSHTHSNYSLTSHTHSYASISSDMGNTNLNNVNGYGIYCNPANAQATTANNYPLAEAGTLFFGNAAYGSSNQIYGTFMANRWFARGGGNNSASKTGWKEFCFIGNNIGTGATNYAAGNHSHSNYSLTSHTHNYAPSSHTHNYLPTSGGTITGNLIVSGNISQTSSRKFKENINNFEDNALNIIANTKIVNYNYINDDNKLNHVGFIAEDTDEILSTKHKNTMDIGSCVGVLMKSIQELNVIIKEQQISINDLKNQIKGLSK